MNYEDKKGRFITRTGWLVMGYIPVVVGVAAITWAMAVHYWMGVGREHRADQRSLHSVGLSDPPKATIKLILHSSPCLVDGRGRIDGTDVWLYIRNQCGHSLDLPNYRYRVEAHDGTVIESGVYAFSGDKSFGEGERREQKLTINADDRTETVEFWMVD